MSGTFDIVLIPPLTIRKRAIRISRNLARHGGLFTLDDKEHVPHITLYATTFDLKDLSNVSRALKSVAARTKRFVAASGAYYQHHQGWVHVRYRKSKNIKQLRQTAIDAVHRYAKGHDLCCAQERTFVPHLTFSKFEQPKRGVLSTLSKLDFSFRARQIGLYYLGEYGTCKKRVALFDLEP